MFSLPLQLQKRPATCFLGTLNGRSSTFKTKSKNRKGVYLVKIICKNTCVCVCVCVCVSHVRNACLKSTPKQL